MVRFVWFVRSLIEGLRMYLHRGTYRSRNGQWSGGVHLSHEKFLSISLLLPFSEAWQLISHPKPFQPGCPPGRTGDSSLWGDEEWEINARGEPFSLPVAKGFLTSTVPHAETPRHTWVIRQKLLPEHIHGKEDQDWSSQNMPFGTEVILSWRHLRSWSLLSV